jgi:hypothetical protein
VVLHIELLQVVARIAVLRMAALRTAALRPLVQQAVAEVAAWFHMTSRKSPPAAMVPHRIRTWLLPLVAELAVVLAAELVALFRRKCRKSPLLVALLHKIHT